MDTQLVASAEKWLDEVGSSVAPDMLKAGGEAGMPVVSGAVLIGPERARTLANAKIIKRGRAAMLSAAAGGPVEDALKAFREDAMNGATSILEMCRSAAGYNPLDLKDPKKKEKHDLYINKVMTAPFFSLVYSNAQRLEHKSKNWDALIDAITDTFEGIAAEDKVQVAKSLGTLAKAAASQESSRQTEDLFVQSVLSANPGQYDVFIYTSHVELQADKSKGSSSKQSLFEIARAKLRFRAVEWPMLADKVWARKVKTTDDWLDENNAKEGGVKTNLCLAVLK